MSLNEILSDQALFIHQTIKISTDFQHKRPFFEYCSFIDVQKTDESQSVF
jgi:hypothetical protein